MSVLLLLVLFGKSCNACVGSPLSCNRGSDYGDLVPCTGTSNLMYVVVLAYLVRDINPLGIMLQGMHLLGLTLIMGLVLFKNSWFPVLGEKDIEYS